jgi:hypothetical protein
LRGRPLRDRYTPPLIALDRVVHFPVLGVLAAAVFLFPANREALSQTFYRVLDAVHSGVGGPTEQDDGGMLGELQKAFAAKPSTLWIAGSPLTSCRGDWRRSGCGGETSGAGERSARGGPGRLEPENAGWPDPRSSGSEARSTTPAACADRTEASQSGGEPKAADPADESAETIEPVHRWAEVFVGCNRGGRVLPWWSVIQVAGRRRRRHDKYGLVGAGR